MLGQREIVIVDDEDHADFFVRQILGASKTGNLSNRPWQFMVVFDFNLEAVAAFSGVFHSLILVVLNGKANDDDTLATVLSIAYHDRSQLNTSVTASYGDLSYLVPYW